MILFTDESAYRILLGLKTMTARHWKSPRAKVGSYHWAQLNRKAESRFARLKILSVEEWSGRSADKEFAKKEGFETPNDFLFSYWELNDHHWNEDGRKHYKIEFEVSSIHQPTPPIVIDGEPLFNKDFVEFRPQQLSMFEEAV